MNNYLSSVVKIVSQDVTFDWYNPYKTYNNSDSSGTGFFIDNNGTILTCFHVIEDSVKVDIIIPIEGHDKYEAEILSVCPSYDIALLRVKGYKNKNYLELGDSDNINQKDKVIAVGFPLSEQSNINLKITNGIISGTHNILLQTDTPINEGNSGGPLIHNNKVIGVNSQKIASWMADNIGYALPIYYFNLIKDSMFKNVKIVKIPYFACSFGISDDNMIKYLKNNEKCNTGCYVKKIIKTSPLYKIGIREGDIICNFDKYKVDNYGEVKTKWSNEKIKLDNLIKRYNINDNISITFLNKSKKILETKNINFNIDNIESIRQKYKLFEKIDYEIFGGFSVMNLNLNHLDNIYNNVNNENSLFILNKFKHIKNRIKNRLIICNIIPGSYLKSINTLQNGSIIRKINNKKVYTLDDYRKVLMSLKNEKYIIIETFCGVRQVLDISKILDEEQKLADNNNYKVSNIYNFFIGKNEKKKKYVYILSTNDCFHTREKNI